MSRVQESCEFDLVSLLHKKDLSLQGEKLKINIFSVLFNS